jgi:hypothetical protein
MSRALSVQSGLMVFRMLEANLKPEGESLKRWITAAQRCLSYR